MMRTSTRRRAEDRERRSRLYRFGLALLCVLGAAAVVAGREPPAKPGTATWVTAQAKLADEDIAAGRYQEAHRRYLKIDERALNLPFLQEFELFRTEELAREGTGAIDALRRARALRYFNKPAEANEIYNQLEQTHAKSPLLQCERAMALLEAGDLEKAAARIAKGEAIDKDSAYVHAARGALLQAQGKFPEALAALELAWKRNPYMGGLSGRRALLLLWQTDRLEGEARTKGADSAAREFATALNERAEFGLGFPWRLAKEPAAEVTTKKLPEVMQRLYRGDLEGVIAALTKFTQNLPPGTSQQDEAFALSLLRLAHLARGDYQRAHATRMGSKGLVLLPGNVRQPFPGPRPLISGGVALSLVRGGAADSMGREPECAEDHLLAAYERIDLVSPTATRPEIIPAALAAAYEHLAQAASARSLAADDPLTARVTTYPDKGALAKLKARIDPVAARVAAGQRLDDPNPWRASISDLGTLVAPPQRLRAQDRFAVREQARFLRDAPIAAASGGEVPHMALALGIRFRDGRGVKRDPKRAAGLLQGAAAKIPAASYELGMMYERGLGVPVDKQRACALYAKAAFFNHQAAKEAHARTVRALQEEFPDGGITIPTIPEFGKQDKGLLGGPVFHRPEDTSLGGAIENEATRGCPLAQRLLAFRYARAESPRLRFGAKWNLPDLEKAFTWYRKAAEQGSALSQYAVGEAYCFGLGTEVDKTEARKWLTLAAEQDVGFAKALLAEMK